MKKTTAEKLTDKVLAFMPDFFGDWDDWQWGDGRNASREIRSIIYWAKKLKKEIETSKQETK